MSTNLLLFFDSISFYPSFVKSQPENKQKPGSMPGFWMSMFRIPSLYTCAVLPCRRGYAAAVC